jgi:hypothetical protein
LSDGRVNAGSMFAYLVVCGEKRRSGVTMAEAQQFHSEQSSGEGGVRNGMGWRSVGVAGRYLYGFAASKAGAMVHGELVGKL